MEISFAVFAALALVLGFKHSFDVDHVVAVSGLLTRQERLGHSVGLAASWAGGHMVTAALVSALVYFFAATVLPAVTARLEILVVVMLLVIGGLGLASEWRRFHIHRHAHPGSARTHTHLHVHFKSPRHEHGAMAGIGVVHGLASNDELLVVLLIGLTASSWWELGLGVGLFSVGVLVGMVLYAAAIHAAGGPVTRRFGWNWVPSALTVVFSVASIGYAVWLLVGGGGMNLVEGWFGHRLPEAA